MHAMSNPTTEFSRLVPLSRLAAGSWRQEITAEPAECRALALRFDLLALDRLAADVELSRGEGGTVLLTAALEAAFVQSCVVTLEPVAGTLSARFQLLYGPPQAEAAAADIAAAPDGPAFEPLDGDAIDIGEAVAQELSLQLPPFPRLPDAVLDEDADSEPGSPLAGLARRDDGRRS
jgi:uncharacterized metal-binding protein YceD (DUF177 family)